MQRIDGAYLYDFGRIMRALADMEHKEWTRLHAHYILNPAYDVLGGILYQSVFTPSWKVVHASAKMLIDEIEPHLINWEDSETFSAVIPAYQVGFIKEKFAGFEAVMKAELQSLAIFHSSPKGGFDVNSLTENGLQIFPGSLKVKVPEAALDAQKGAKAMGFEMWTAMAFHLHRANEAVLRRYYRGVIGSHRQPKLLTMGTMLSSLEDKGVGDANIRAAIKNITVFHRNPNAHPDQHIENADEAINLYAAIRASMGYMLEKLPDAAVAPLPPVPPPLQLAP